MDSVVHFELPYDNSQRMAKFYETAFGWKTQLMGEEMGNYVVAKTTESTEAGPVKPGAINGGFFARNPDGAAQHPSFVVSVDDISAGMKKVNEAGGNTVGEPMDIPGVGKFVPFVDTEGNRLSLLQPLPRGAK